MVACLLRFHHIFSVFFPVLEAKTTAYLDRSFIAPGSANIQLPGNVCVDYGCKLCSYT